MDTNQYLTILYELYMKKLVKAQEAQDYANCLRFEGALIVLDAVCIKMMGNVPEIDLEK